MDMKNLEKAIEYESSKGGSKSPKPKLNEMIKNLKWYEITMACWPLVLVTFGGAIGGGLGGLTCALNFKIFNSKLSKPLKYIYSLLIGVGGILLYLVVVTVLVAIFPNIFNKK